MQLLKRRLFAMRNGVVADALRKGGAPFHIIFGVNLPQLAEIAAETGRNKELAQKAWANSTTRESMLIAPMLMPDEDFAVDEAHKWIKDIPAAEVADVLCHKLLRKQPYALALAQELMTSDETMRRYTGLRLMCNLASSHPAEAVAAGKAELNRECPMRALADILLSYSELLQR